jgi:hypothetical protein
MLQMAVRVILGALGAIMVAIAVVAFIHPVQLGAELGLIGQGQAGIGTIRGDIAGFFALGGVSALLSAWGGIRSNLIVPIFLIGAALAGRLATLALMGPDPLSVHFITVEAGMAAALLLAFFTLRRR